MDRGAPPPEPGDRDRPGRKARGSTPGGDIVGAVDDPRDPADELEALERRAAELEAQAREHQETEARLRLELKILRQVLDALPQRVFWKDRDFQYLGCNQSFAADAGILDPAKVVGRTDPELIWSRSAHLTRADDVAVVERQFAKVNYEESRTGPGGEERWLRSTKKPLWDGDRIVGVVGCYEDVTDEKQEIVSLRASEARYRNLVDQAEDGIFLSDDQGNYLTVNPAGCGMLGYSVEELQQMNLSDILSDEEVQIEPPAGLSDRSSRFVQRRLRRKDGSTFIAEIHAKVLPNGDVEGIVRDVSERVRIETERRDLEEALQHSQRLESVGRLAGGVAHDFNNLLSVVLANAHLARSEFAGKGVEIPELDEIIEASDRASRLTRQLLAFSRKQVRSPQTIDLNEVVRSTQSLLKPLLGEKIEIEIDLVGQPTWVWADVAQMEQVIVNLAVNARDAMSGQGKLSIRTRVEPRWAVLEVSDDGAGMDEAVRDRLFEPFFTTKGPGKGTGLGLSTVYGIVIQSDGRIEVDSRPDHGATFRLEFPIAANDDEDESAETTEEADARPLTGRILIAEDEPAVRRTLEAILTRAGHELLIAENGDDAARISDADPDRIDLLLSDVVMPGLSGPALAQRLRQTRPGIRVLLISGYADQLLPDTDALESGMSFMEKPFMPSDLLARVSELLAEARQPPANEAG